MRKCFGSPNMSTSLKREKTVLPLFFSSKTPGNRGISVCTYNIIRVFVTVYCNTRRLFHGGKKTFFDVKIRFTTFNIWVTKRIRAESFFFLSLVPNHINNIRRAYLNIQALVFLLHTLLKSIRSVRKIMAKRRVSVIRFGKYRIRFFFRKNFSTFSQLIAPFIEWKNDNTRLWHCSCLYLFERPQIRFFNTKILPYLFYILHELSKHNNDSIQKTSVARLLGNRILRKWITHARLEPNIIQYFIRYRLRDTNVSDIIFYTYT